VLRVNHAELVSSWLDRVRRGAFVGGTAWLLWRALLGFPWVGGRVLGAIHETSWRAQVHHRALVELSVVAPGAFVGADAIVRGSYVGAGARVDDGAHVIGSVVAPGAFVGRRAVVIGSVLYPGALAGQHLMQMSVLGRSAMALTNSWFFDFNFERNVRVASAGGFVDVGGRALGVCLGPGARVAAGVWVASGREVPAGAMLVKAPGEVAGKLPPLPPGEPSVVRDGVVAPLRKPIE
jgi:hypothetical protein